MGATRGPFNGLSCTPAIGIVGINTAVASMNGEALEERGRS
jgi:hypothetical protein